MSDASISQADPGDMTLAELRDEHADLEDVVDPFSPYEGQEDAWDRKQKVWRAIRKRVDVQEPKCRKCGERHWSQAAGDPVVCRGCGAEGGAEIEEAVHDAWDAMLDRGNDTGSD